MSVATIRSSLYPGTITLTFGSGFCVPAQIMAHELPERKPPHPARAVIDSFVPFLLPTQPSSPTYGKVLCGGDI